MKQYLSWFATSLVGAAVGASVASAIYTHAIRTSLPSTLQQLESEQRYRCLLSLAALERLETNEPDRTKLLLAREIASYYKHPLGLAESVERKKILERIDNLRVKSSALNEALAKEPQ